MRIFEVLPPPDGESWDSGCSPGTGLTLFGGEKDWSIYTNSWVDMAQRKKQFIEKGSVIPHLRSAEYGRTSGIECPR